MYMVQWKAYTNLCGTMEILYLCVIQWKSYTKFMWYKYNPGQKKTHKKRPIPGKGILYKTSQDEPHPRKSWTKPHKMRPIPGNPGQNLTRCDPSPEIPKRPSNDNPLAWLLLVGCWLFPTTCAETPCGYKHEENMKIVYRNQKESMINCYANNDGSCYGNNDGE